MTLQEKKWYQSKTKWGALLIGVSAVLGTVGGALTGGFGTDTLFTLLTEIGAVLAVFGIRDLPIFNSFK